MVDDLDPVPSHSPRRWSDSNERLAVVEVEVKGLRCDMIDVKASIGKISESVLRIEKAQMLNNAHAEAAAAAAAAKIDTADRYQQWAKWAVPLLVSLAALSLTAINVLDLFTGHTP